MKKITICSRCSYKINEHLKQCPLCNEKMTLIKGDKRILNQHFSPSLDSNANISLSYYCKKCQSFDTNKICVINNSLNSLALKYYDRFILLENIEHLQEVFTLEERLEIIGKLSLDELDLIYYSYKNAYQYFYRQDKNKAGLMFLLSFVISYLALLLANYYQSDATIIVSYFALAFGIGVFFIFFTLGIMYLINASSIEYNNLTKSISLFAILPSFIYGLVMVIIYPSFTLALRYALISLGAIFLIYLIYSLWRKK